MEKNSDPHRVSRATNCSAVARDTAGQSQGEGGLDAKSPSWRCKDYERHEMRDLMITALATLCRRYYRLPPAGEMTMSALHL